MVLQKHKKKIIIAACAVILLTLLWTVFLDQGANLSLTNESSIYKGLGMRPEWDVADNIVSAPDTKAFAGPLYNLGYTTFLHGDGPFTVFVPVNASYDNLPTQTKAYLADIQHQGTIRQLLLYHVVKGRYLASDLKDNMRLTTVEGEPLIIRRNKDSIIVNGRAFVKTKDIIVKNGVIHTIDNFLFPPTMANLQEPFQ